MKRTAPTSVAECDRELTFAHAALVLALDRGDTIDAEIARNTLDDLLDLRLLTHP